MQKIFFTLLMSFILVNVISPTASADLLPPDSHPVDICVKFVNLDKFPEIVLIGSYTGPMLQEAKTYLIENNKCLTKGYKFNTLDIYWDKKDNVDTTKPIVKAENILLQGVEVASGNVSSDNPLIAEIIEYSVAGISTNNSPVLYASKQTSKFNNGQSDNIETFKNPLSGNQKKNIDPVNINDDEINIPISTKNSFWDRIACFFKALFGKAC